MSSSKGGRRGITTGEVVFILFIIGVVLVAVFAVLGHSKKAAPAGATKPSRPAAASVHYAGLTTPDGLVPIKAVITPSAGSDLYESPSLSSRVVGHAAKFAIYVALRRQESFLEVGTDPLSKKAVGWVPRGQVLLWATKEALRPNKANSERQPLRLWTEKSDVGNRDKVAYEEIADADPPPPYPVLEADGSQYRIAMTWQSEDFSDKGVDSAWTAAVAVPDDVRFFYYVSRDELRNDFESINQALLDLGSGGSSEHPINELLKPHIRLTVGDQIDLQKEDDLPLLRRILRNLRNPLSTTEKQRADIERDTARMKQDLVHLREFYQNPDNWNAQGEGWLPREYLPAR